MTFFFLFNLCDIKKQKIRTNKVAFSTFGEAAALLAASLTASMQLKIFTLEGDSLIVFFSLQHPSINVQHWHIENLTADAVRFS